MKPDDAQVRVSGLKNVAVQLRGPAGVVILVSWLAAVVAVSVWAQGIGLAVASSLLAYFIGAYFTTLSRS